MSSKHETEDFYVERNKLEGGTLGALRCEPVCRQVMSGRGWGQTGRPGQESSEGLGQCDLRAFLLREPQVYVQCLRLCSEIFRLVSFFVPL